MTKKTSVGGQAVIEGVMMRGTKSIATAVRKSDGEIVMDVEYFIPFTKRHWFFALPIVRGFVALIESLVIGINTLNKSAAYCEDDFETSKFELWIQEKFKEKSGSIITAFTLIISLTIAVLLFFIFPTFAANVFVLVGIKSSFMLNIFEGLIRVAVFISYIYLIGKIEDIKRVFQYHGAEHKTIFCYENEMDLTPENAKKFGRLHPRCGTNFLFLVMIVSIIIFSFTGWESLPERIISRVLLLPLVSGVTYELIRWMGKSKSKFSHILAYPGLMLQKLTTKEPDMDQLEVAIAALKAAEGIEYDIKE
jgi:uncharacterized protein YqhQ